MARTKNRLPFTGRVCAGVVHFCRCQPLQSLARVFDGTSMNTSLPKSMSLMVVGLNHRTAPIELRERLAFSHNRLDSILPGLNDQLDSAGVVLLSTCNR